MQTAIDLIKERAEKDKELVEAKRRFLNDSFVFNAVNNGTGTYESIYAKHIKPIEDEIHKLLGKINELLKLIFKNESVEEHKRMQNISRKLAELRQIPR